MHLFKYHKDLFEDQFFFYFFLSSLGAYTIYFKGFFMKKIFFFVALLFVINLESSDQFLDPNHVDVRLAMQAMKKTCKMIDAFLKKINAGKQDDGHDTDEEIEAMFDQADTLLGELLVASSVPEHQGAKGDDR